MPFSILVTTLLGKRLKIFHVIVTFQRRIRGFYNKRYCTTYHQATYSTHGYVKTLFIKAGYKQEDYIKEKKHKEKMPKPICLINNKSIVYIVYRMIGYILCSLSDIPY